MYRCEVCGNQYDKAFQVVIDNEPHFYDCFECAIHALAPKCESCGVRVIGHGVEAEGSIYCCARCASKQGIDGLKDRVFVTDDFSSR